MCGLGSTVRYELVLVKLFAETLIIVRCTVTRGHNEPKKTIR